MACSKTVLDRAHRSRAGDVSVHSHTGSTATPERYRAPAAVRWGVLRCSGKVAVQPAFPERRPGECHGGATRRMTGSVRARRRIPAWNASRRLHDDRRSPHSNADRNQQECQVSHSWQVLEQSKGAESEEDQGSRALRARRARGGWRPTAVPRSDKTNRFASPAIQSMWPLLLMGTAKRSRRSRAAGTSSIPVASATETARAGTYHHGVVDSFMRTLRPERWRSGAARYHCDTSPGRPGDHLPRRSSAQSSGRRQPVPAEQSLRTRPISQLPQLPTA